MSNDTTENFIKIDFAEKPVEKDYIICYIDLLGTKQMIGSKLEKKYFDLIYQAYSYALEIESKLHIYGDFVFKVFSDNILIAHEITSERDWHTAYQKVVNFLKRYLYTFLMSGTLFRGGLTIGKLAINDLLFGAAVLLKQLL